MNAVPYYKKWFADSAIATSNTLQNLYPGQILAFNYKAKIDSSFDMICDLRQAIKENECISHLMIVAHGSNISNCGDVLCADNPDDYFFKNEDITRMTARMIDEHMCIGGKIVLIACHVGKNPSFAEILAEYSKSSVLISDSTVEIQEKYITITDPELKQCELGWFGGIHYLDDKIQEPFIYTTGKWISINKDKTYNYSPFNSSQYLNDGSKNNLLTVPQIMNFL